jgi:uncharacterized circularly permuted ATP-grasp superfamily protein/uncharacterized alpha-E superfamily protein
MVTPRETAVTADFPAGTPLIANYRPLPGVFDEMMDDAGRVRAHWRPFLGMLAALGPDEIERRFAAADRHLRDSGVFYRVYEDKAGVERAWPLSHVPLVIDPDGWRSLKAGLVERAELLETVLADTYGPANLVREGRLPAAVIAGNPEYLRPLVGAAPAGSKYLQFYAADVGRAPDGSWWVLSDRAQAPSGAGFAIENRLALASGLPDIYRALRVERLASFFQTFQADLAALNRRDDSRVCLLTPGPLNENYFEHAYLARYLGLLLVQGEDLTVRPDGVFIRTVSGLKRADVLLRRLDADFCDPLELNARSQLGVPGLVQAVREGHVTIANALGAGIIEARAILSFLPALAPSLIGRKLALPNLATWWLGDRDVRADILGRLDKVVIASAFQGELPFAPGASQVLGASLQPANRMLMSDAITRRGIDFVAQEAATLSTMPAWHNGRLEPRPFILRLFLARSGDGWTVMPGGFVRVADDIDTRAISLQQGGRTADAWILAEGPVSDTTLLPRPERIVIHRASSTLPSRTADNLFWVGRYVERAEATLRVVRALINRAMESDDTAQPDIEKLGELLRVWEAVPTDLPNAKPALLAAAALQRTDLPGAVPSLVAGARAAASVIRDRLSPDGWRAVTDLYDMAHVPLGANADESVLIERVQAALRIVASFSGLAQENMSQITGWRFLELGRRIERSIATCRFIRQFAYGPLAEGGLDTLLELCDSQITYRARYVMIAARAPVIDLVALDPENPRSLAYQVGRIETHLATLPKENADSRLSPAEQIVIALATTLRTSEPSTLTSDSFAQASQAMMSLANHIAAAYFTLRERMDAGTAGTEELG